MPVGRTEHFHHTPEQLAEALDTALRTLRNADLEPDEHPELLTAVFGAACAKNIMIEQVQPGLPLMQIPRG